MCLCGHSVVPPPPQVTENDAIDVVDLLHESLLDAVTLDTGQIDFGRKGGMSMAKQVRGGGFGVVCLI